MRLWWWHSGRRRATVCYGCWRRGERAASTCGPPWLRFQAAPMLRLVICIPDVWYGIRLALQRRRVKQSIAIPSCLVSAPGRSPLSRQNQRDGAEHCELEAPKCLTVLQRGRHTGRVACYRPHDSLAAMLQFMHDSFAAVARSACCAATGCGRRRLCLLMLSGDAGCGALGIVERAGWSGGSKLSVQSSVLESHR